MKVAQSDYLQQVKPRLKALLNELLKEYEYASILATDSKEKQYMKNKVSISVGQNPIFNGFGAVVKVYDGKGYGEYSFNEMDEETLAGVVTAIRENLIPLSGQLPDGLIPSDYPCVEDETEQFCESTEYEVHPAELGNEKMLARIEDLFEKGMHYDERILDCTVRYTYREYSNLFLSPNKEMEQNLLYSTAVAYIMTAKGEEIKDSVEGLSGLCGAELLEKMEQVIVKAANTALDLLDSVPMVPGEYDCICTPEMTGMIVHEAFGHGVEMDMFVKKRALAEQYIGEYVASPLVTMHDGAAAAKQTATYFFDDEGVKAKDTVVIEKGILKRGISDSQTAMHLHTEPTGNGRRESFERKAYSRMTNTFFEAGTDKVEDMIASIEYGFLLENTSSGMEDPKNWGIQCMVSCAREIKDGKLTGKICAPVVLTGYVPDLLKSISMVSDTVELSGLGFCGKGYKEWVKVSDGGPYIKARIRLG